MASSQLPDRLSNVDIDPNAHLVIHLHLSDLAPAPAPPASTHHRHAEALAQYGPDQQDQPQVRPGQLTPDEVANMSLEELDRLQECVAEMEISDHGLLPRVDGQSPVTQQPFPIAVASQSSTVGFPRRGSLSHRQLLFPQYSNMLAIAQDPTRCADIVEPATARGAKTVQDYQTQLILLAQNGTTQRKRKQHDDDNGFPLRPAPKVEPQSVEAMDQYCRVLDFGLRTPQPMHHRHERSSPKRALLDYQQQLVLLEQQNQKRLRMAKKDQARSRVAEAGVREVSEVQ